MFGELYYGIYVKIPEIFTENTQNASCKANTTDLVSLEHLSPATIAGSKIRFWLKKLRGAFFLVIGFLLSPMSW
jgi:hypothetical protein